MSKATRIHKRVIEVPLASPGRSRSVGLRGRSQSLPRKRACESRAGFSLVEMVGVLISTGLLLSFSALLLKRAYSSHAEAFRHLQSVQRLRNACERFRTDVHAALQVEVSSEQLHLHLQDGRTVRYAAELSLTDPGREDASIKLAAHERTGDVLKRVLLDGDQEVGWERWRLNRSYEIDWSVDRQQKVPCVRCQLIAPNKVPIIWLASLRAEQSDDLGHKPVADSQSENAVP